MTKENEMNKADDRQTDKKERTFEPVESNFVKFTEFDQSVEGEILSIDVESSPDFKLYTIKDDDGVVRKFHDSTQLSDLLRQVKVGDYIKVTYLNDEKFPNGTLKIFSLDVSKTT